MFLVLSAAIIATGVNTNRYILRQSLNYWVIVIHDDQDREIELDVEFCPAANGIC